MEGRSIFFTGSAGTGKSFLLLKIIRDLQKKYGAECVAVTAPTGIAACNIGGVTLHSFAGIGQGTEPLDKLYSIVFRNEKAAGRWKQAKVLIIDEISMLDGGLFDKLEYIARRIRGGDRPFGGLQLVVAGDFFQLPPVGLAGINERTGGSSSMAGGSMPQSPPVKFAFQSAAWGRTLYAQLPLTKVFRQSDDKFVKLLNEFREGIVGPHTSVLLETAGSGLPAAAKASGAKPTCIYALNRLVDEVNSREMGAATGPLYQYRAKDAGIEPFLSNLKNSCQAPDLLELKLGVQVMLLKNLDAARGLVNGARGVVVGFSGESKFPEVRFPTRMAGGTQKKAPATEGEGEQQADSFVETIEISEWTAGQMGEVVATRSQIPLKLAYALSMHKSQVRM